MHTLSAIKIWGEGNLDQFRRLVVKSKEPHGCRGADRRGGDIVVRGLLSGGGKAEGGVAGPWPLLGARKGTVGMG